MRLCHDTCYHGLTGRSWWAQRLCLNELVGARSTMERPPVDACTLSCGEPESPLARPPLCQQRKCSPPCFRVRPLKQPRTLANKSGIMHACVHPSYQAAVSR